MARNPYREEQLRQQIAGLPESLAAVALEVQLAARIQALEGVVNAIRNLSSFLMWGPLASGAVEMTNSLILSGGGDISLDFISFPNYLALNIKNGVILGSQIGNDEVAFGNLQNIDTARVLGRMTAGNGDIEELETAHLDGILSQRVFAQRL